MISKLFKSVTNDDLLLALCSTTFNNRKIDKIFKKLSDINSDINLKEIFLLCVEKNLTESIKWLISKKVDINCLNDEGDTALIIASRLGYFDIAKLLITEACNIDSRNKLGRVAIQEAVKCSNKDIYHLLKNKSKNINNIDLNKHSLIFDAVFTNNIEFIELILKNNNIKISNDIVFYDLIYSNLNIFTVIFKKIDTKIKYKCKKGKSPLFYLVNKGILALEYFKYLMSLSYDLNHLDNEGNNILLELIIFIETTYFKNNKNNKKELENLTKMISFLLEEKVDYKVVNKEGHNIFTYLASKNNTFLIRYLLEHELDANIVNAKKETALCWPTLKNTKDLDLFALLLDNNALTNIKDINNKTIIEKLITCELVIKNNKKSTIKDRNDIDIKIDYLGILRELLLNGKNKLETLTSLGEPYLFDAVIHNNIDLVKLLIKHGADINQNDDKECNIIFKYISENTSAKESADEKLYYDMLRKIISLGADINARDDFGGTTLHKAILVSDLQTCKILINDGANIGLRDGRGRNMIHNTIWKNKLKIFRMLHLLDKELINKADNYGILPINYAAFLGHHKLVVELISKGAHINNSNKKPKSIQDFLYKFHKNINPMLNNITNDNDRNKAVSLVENMKKEFSINV